MSPTPRNEESFISYRGVDDPIRRGTDRDPNTGLYNELASFNITAVSMKHSITVPLALQLLMVARIKDNQVTLPASNPSQSHPVYTQNVLACHYIHTYSTSQ